MEETSSAQRAVAETYDQAIAGLHTLQDNWVYMTSKQLSDYALLSDADIDGTDVLNIGCSFPIDEVLLAHRVRRWTAIDLGEETISVAAAAAEQQLHPDLFQRLRFQVADATALPFDDASFDVVVSFSTIDHIVDAEGRQRVVNEMARVTKPGGRVVVTVPNRWNRGYAKRAKFFGEEAALDSFEYCFSPPELKRMVGQAGLDIVRFTSVSELPILAPRLLLPRRLRRPLVGVYNRLARPFGVRMGVLAVRAQGS